MLTPEHAPAQPWLLTLIFPSVLEETVVGHLLEHPEWASAFTLVRCEGHGQEVALHGSEERVRGRSARLMAHVVLGFDESTRLLGHFAETVRSPHVFYWRMPLADAGRLCDFPAAGSQTSNGGDGWNSD